MALYSIFIYPCDTIIKFTFQQFKEGSFSKSQRIIAKHSLVENDVEKETIVTSIMTKMV